MYFGNDNPFNLKNHNDSLFYSPEKPDIDTKLYEDANFISDFLNKEENICSFNTLNEKVFQSDNLSDSSSRKDQNIAMTFPKPRKSSILKLDFLEELLKDDLEIKSQQNLLKSLSFQFFSPINNLNHSESSNLKKPFKESKIMNTTEIIDNIPLMKQNSNEICHNFSGNSSFLDNIRNINHKRKNDKNDEKIRRLKLIERKKKIERYLQKKSRRKWDKKKKYNCEKKVKNTRLRIKGRFIKKKPVNNNEI